ncbi:MAG: prenyltransferase [Pseudomonadota bacterium]
MEHVLIPLSESRWRVLQPAIYLVSVLPALLCAVVFNGQFRLEPLLLMGVAVVLIQHAINVFNDETDWQRGADGEKKLSWYHFHQGNPAALKCHAWISLLLGVTLGILAVIESKRIEVLWAALPLVGLGFLYNFSQWALSYTRWGEWVTGICYGPGVFGCMAYVLTGELSKEVILGSVSCSCLAVSVLLSHQPPQVLTDFAAGKKSFAVRHGTKKTYATAKLLCQIGLLLQALVFSGEMTVVVSQALVWLVSGGLVFTLPNHLSPPIVLKRNTLQILFFGLYLKIGAL